MMTNRCVDPSEISSTSPSAVMRCWMLYGPPCVERGATSRLSRCLEMEDIDMSLNAILEPETSTVGLRPRADRDLDLLEALRRHEPTAAERLVTTYGQRAYRLAASITGNEQDAEEVVHDAFWSVIRKIDTFRGESAFGSWLYRIVANAAYQKLRIQQGRRRVVSAKAARRHHGTGCHRRSVRGGPLTLTLSPGAEFAPVKRAGRPGSRSGTRRRKSACSLSRLLQAFGDRPDEREGGVVRR